MDRDLVEAVKEMRERFDYMSDETFERAMSEALKEEDYKKLLEEGKCLRVLLKSTDGNTKWWARIFMREDHAVIAIPSIDEDDLLHYIDSKEYSPIVIPNPLFPE